MFFKKTLLDFFGFKKNSNYVKKYLNEANFRSTIYMTFIIIVIEIWMIFRSHDKYVIPAIKGGTDWFKAVFTNTSLFWLFMLAGVTMMIFSIFYVAKRKRGGRARKKTLIPIIASSILILYTLFIFKELEFFKSWDTRYYRINNLGIIFLYSFAFLLGVATITYSIIQYRTGKDSEILSLIIIVMFACMCLSFGIKVGYTDFFSRFNNGTGLPRPNSDGIYEIKSIICFLTMVIYVACLLIWKPYISIIILTAVFVGFSRLLDGDPANRVFADGEEVNYITFLISLTMITISIYQQRIREARNSEKLEKIAKYDGLTGLYSYGEFVRLTTNYLLDLENDIHDKIFLFMNIENFKSLNSQNGFAEGNLFLKSFGHRLAEIFEGDIIGRQGDDHFVMFTDISTMMEKIDKSREALKDITNVFMDIKVGGYIPIERDVEVRSEIDKARYASGRIKNKYGKYYLEYDSKMDELFHKRQYVVNNIDKAIEEGWIKAYYQPVVWSNDGKLCGCEALARWIDPIYGFLSPGDFIPVLEECRQIYKLDTAIFNIVCKDLRMALDSNMQVVPVSLNFSRLDFELMDAVGVFEEAVAKYNIPKQYLHVEVTESALSDDLGLLQESMNRFVQDGFAIWLDDFGSGYSSLNVLKDYDFDVLKIDMKFLSNFSTNQKARDIVDCVIKLADSLGMKSLCEGVETKEQAEFLKKAGCLRLQGYLFGKPLPKEQLIEDIKTGKYVISNETL